MTKRAKGTLALILAFVVLANAGIFWKMSYSKTHTSGDTIVVRVGDTVAANHPISQALYIFEEELERISNGRFDVRVYINSALGGDRQQTESVILGYMQGNTPPTSVLAGFDTRFMVVDLPFVFKSGEAAMKTLNGDLGEELDPILEDLGLHAVGWTESGYRHITTNNIEATSPEALKGLTSARRKTPSTWRPSRRGAQAPRQWRSRSSSPRCSRARSTRRRTRWPSSRPTGSMRCRTPSP